MLIPKQRKYKKAQKSVTKSLKAAKKLLSFGSYGLKAIENGYLTPANLEAVRRVIIRHIKQIGKIWIRVFPDKPITQKPTKTRMGKGKGSVQYWVCGVSRGRLIFELRGSLTETVAKTIFKKASKKLPLRSKFVTF